MSFSSRFLFCLDFGQIVPAHCCNWEWKASYYIFKEGKEQSLKYDFCWNAYCLYTTICQFEKNWNFCYSRLPFYKYHMLHWFRFLNFFGGVLYDFQHTNAFSILLNLYCVYVCLSDCNKSLFLILISYYHYCLLPCSSS